MDKHLTVILFMQQPATIFPYFLQYANVSSRLHFPHLILAVIYNLINV